MKMVRYLFSMFIHYNVVLCCFFILVSPQIYIEKKVGPNECTQFGRIV